MAIVTSILFHKLHHFLKYLRFPDRQFRKHFSIQTDLFARKLIDKTAVLNPVAAKGSIEPRNPKTPIIALLYFAPDIRLPPGHHHGAPSKTPNIMALIAISLRLFEDFFMAFFRHDAAFDSHREKGLDLRVREKLADFFVIARMYEFAAILKRLLPFAFIDKQVLLARFSQHDFPPAGDFYALPKPLMRFEFHRNII